MRYSVPVAYILWLVSGCGWLGFHRFYLGKNKSAILWILTGGIGGIGLIYDFFTLGKQVEAANMKYEALSGRGYSPYLGQYSAPYGEAPKAESLEKVILRTAHANHGQVTPGEVALEGDFSVEECKKALDKLAQAGSAELRVRASGVVVYVFPEFVPQGKDDFIV